MKSKLLFIFGIVIAHGAVAAGLMHDLSSPQRGVALSCTNLPTADPYFAPPRELLALVSVPLTAGEVMQP
ncbi:MAG TPA: hypothetical protein VK624_14950 [Steroidobacteraceae bacterium]|jgi:hypothetical protein|nr:hypothetical protein [Steroidobacteraceae bacterium]